MPNHFINDATAGNNAKNSDAGSGRTHTTSASRYTSNHVAELLSDTGYSRKSLTKLLGVSDRTISRWIERESIPEAARLVCISLRDGMPVHYDKAWKRWSIRGPDLVMPSGMGFKIGDLITYDYLRQCGLLDVRVLVDAQDRIRSQANLSHRKVAHLKVLK